MKLLGGNDERNIVREQPVRSQDDAAVGYIFQRQPPHEAEYAAQFAQKQARWACGDEHSIDNPDKWKYNPPNPMGGNGVPGGVGGGIGPIGIGTMGAGGNMGALGAMGTNGGLHQMPNQVPNQLGNNGGMNAAMQQAAAVAAAKHNQMLNQQQQQQQQQQHQHQQQVQQQQQHQHLSHQQMQNHLGAQNHMNSNMLNHAMTNQQAAAVAGMQMQIPGMQGNIYDHVHPSVNMNGVPKPPGQPGPEQLVYLSSQPHMGMMPQNQYMTAANRNAAAITTSTAKKLWEKSDGKEPIQGGVTGSPLNPLHIPGVADHPVWKDSTWSTQTEHILAPSRPRTFPQAPDTNQTANAGILSPRDATSGLGVKMVEYVLGGSPTNKESPLSGLEPRLRSLKFDDADKSHDDKEKSNSPFDTNGLKKDDQVTTTNGVIVNGIDDDKGFNRTPGSRQPSPAEESLPRPPTLLDPTQHAGFPPHHLHHMLSSMDHQGPGGPQMNSYPHHQMQPPVMNGVGGMQMAQSPMMNHQGQGGPNQIESPANLLQQQPPNFDVQQLFRSQNPGLDSTTKFIFTTKWIKCWRISIEYIIGSS